MKNFSFIGCSERWHEDFSNNFISESDEIFSMENILEPMLNKLNVSRDENSLWVGLYLQSHISVTL
jgi:hypothetical protein